MAEANVTRQIWDTGSLLIILVIITEGVQQRATRFIIKDKHYGDRLKELKYCLLYQTEGFTLT